MTVPVVELIKLFSALVAGIDDTVVIAAGDKLDAAEPNVAVVVPSDELTAVVAELMEAVVGVVAIVDESPAPPFFEFPTDPPVADPPEGLVSFAS